MSRAELELENLTLDNSKKKTETDVLLKNLKLERIKAAIAFIAAIAFVFSYFLDRYKARVQADRDRRAAIVTEYDKLYTGTLHALLRVSADTLFYRLNVQAHLDKLNDLEKKLGDRKADADYKELFNFIGESKGLCVKLLADAPAKYEFRQWSDAIDLEQTWAAKSQSLTPDFEDLFGNDLQKLWPGISTSATVLLRKQYSLQDTVGSPEWNKFQTEGAAFQKQLYGKLR